MDSGAQKETRFTVESQRSTALNMNLSLSISVSVLKDVLSTVRETKCRRCTGKSRIPQIGKTKEFINIHLEPNHAQSDFNLNLKQKTKPSISI